MPSKWTPRHANRNRLDTAHKYSIKILHELEIVQGVYGEIKHKNQDYIQAVVEFGVLYRDMIVKLRSDL